MHEVIAELERDRERLRRATKDGSSTDDLVAAFPPPSDIETRERVSRLRERLKQAADLKKKGDFAGALQLAQQVVDEAPTVDYAPLQAASLYTLGNLQHRTGDSASAKATLYRSAELAARAGDDWQIANVWVFLVGVIGQGLRRFQEAEAIATVAEVAIVRLGDNPSLRSRLLNSRGRNLALEGRAQDALREHERALALDEDTHGPEHPLVVITLAHLAEALLELGRTQRALRHIERALEICKKQKKRGPTFATCLLLFGRAKLRDGALDEAEQALLEARTKFERYPDRSADLMEVHVELAKCRAARNEAASG
jgi:tetratricopeptide (TPR) repeat protein